MLKVNTHKNRRTRLRAWREDAGLSLTQAAAELGMSPATLGPIEVGRLRPTRAMAGRLEERFGEPIAELLKSAPRGVVSRLISADSKVRDARSD